MKLPFNYDPKTRSLPGLSGRVSNMILPGRWVAAGLAFLLLSGCNFSLAADVTPPPGYQPPPQVTEGDGSEPAPTGPLFPIVPPDLEQGAAIYVEKCAPCHGVNGMGDGAQAPNLANQPTALGAPDVARQAVPAEWFQVVTDGDLEQFMPPFKSLTDRQRWDVVAFALSLHQSQESLAEGGRLYDEQCAACHGKTGDGDGPEAGPQMIGLRDQERMAGRSANALFQVITGGVDGKMPSFGDELSETQRWALTGYLRQLTFAPRIEAVVATPGSTTTQVPAGLTLGTGLKPAPTGSPAAQTPSVPATTMPLSATPAISTTLTLAPTRNITGTVTNGSGGELPEGLTVILHAFDQMQLVMTDTARLRDDGLFIFQDVEAPVGRSFLTTIEFDQVLYGSDLLTVQAEGQPILLNMKVYEQTNDHSALVIDRLHIFFELSGEQLSNEQTLRVAELFVISNPGQSTIVGDGPGKPVIQFQLPPGAANLRIEDGELGGRYVKTENGFADTIPIRPGMGNYQVLYSYELPYNRSLNLVRPVQFTTQAVVVLSPENGIKVRSADLVDAGTRELQGFQYHTYSGDAMPAGSVIELSLSGRPSSTAGNTVTSTTKTNLLIGGGALGIAMLVVGVWMYLRDRRSQGKSDDQSVQSFGDGQEDLMDAILALDDLYQEGKLPEDAYRQRRAELKDRLARVMGEAR